MSDNRALWKSFHSLTHPIVIASILILLFNDHWLRHAYPSWLTGKLGDFTWLVFMPFLVTPFLAWIIPHTYKKQSEWVGMGAIAITGLWFAMVKTVPVVHWATTETLYTIMGYQGSFRMDATDLITLPALVISWWVWRDASDSKIGLKPVFYVMLGLGILATLASDDPTYDVTSIETICELQDGTLVASYVNRSEWTPDNTSEFTYVSTTSGMTWHYAPEAPIYPYDGMDERIRCSETGVTAVSDDNNTYRWVRGEYIERQTVSGDWEIVHHLRELDQDVREYGNHNPFITNYDTDPAYIESPVSGIIHSNTGNLILAMSSDGALVITPAGQSEWVAIGDYQLDNLQDSDLITEALQVQLYLLPTLWFLILVSTVTLIHSERLFPKIWLSLGWVSWVILVFTGHNVFYAVNSYAVNTDYAFIWGLQALGSLVIIGIPMSLWALGTLAKYYGRASIEILITVVLASVAYLLPLAMWSQGTIARYILAVGFSLILVACVLATSYNYFRDKLPARHVPEKSKRKQKPKNDTYEVTNDVG